MFSWALRFNGSDPVPEYDLHRLGKRSHYEIGRVHQLLRIAAVHKNGAAPGCLARGDVSPPVSHHERTVQVDGPVPRRLQEHARLRFATGTPVRSEARLNS